MRATFTSSTRRRLGYAGCGVLAVATVALLAGPSGIAIAASPDGGKDGMLCERPTSSTATSEVFALDAADGYVSMPDGNSIYMWSYTGGGHAFQFPGPTLCARSGDSVTVILHNTLREDTSIVFSGQGAVDANGRPVQPVVDTTGRITSLTDVATANGGTATYTFTAGSPGTYLYASGTDVRKQRDMGLYGALVVHPTSEPTPGLAHATQDAHGVGNGYAYDASQEYLHLLSQIDPDLHAAVEVNKPYDYTKSVPRYFLINGRSMPDTLAPNNAAWLPSQPYGALLHIEPTNPDPAAAVKAGHPQAMLHYLNAGEDDYPFHPHGSSQRVVVRDGSPALDGAGADAAFEKFLVDVAPGQSVDTLVSWGTEDASGLPYDIGAKQIPSDIQLPSIQDQVVGPGTETWFSENPYLGPGLDGKTVNPIPNGMTQNNQCGEYYQIAHNHALQASTNYGASFGGMMTLIRIDPPGHFDCKGL